MDLIEAVLRLPSDLLAIVDSGRSAYILVPAYMGLLLIERAIFLIARKSYSGGDALPNLASTALGYGVEAVIGGAFAATFIFVFDEWRLWTLPYDWRGFLAAYLIFEFLHYVQHWLGHRTGFFWAVHSVHHSSADFNVPVASRLSWAGFLLRPIMFAAPVLGVSPLHLGVIGLVTTIWGIVNHTQVVPKLGWLEHILVTPANHRAHHGSQPKYLDVNYGQTLLLFDKLFGTHQLEEERPIFGLVNQVEQKNPFLFQAEGFRSLFAQMGSAPRISDKLRYLVLPPGWSHLGDHSTADVIKARAGIQRRRRGSKPSSFQAAHRSVEP